MVSKAASEDGGILPLDRFKGFSDGVFAIVITLLVLEITAPKQGVPLLPALREAWPEFLGYYISFAFVGGLWVVHSAATRLMKGSDAVTYSLNLLLLFFAGLLPFATKVMVTHLTGADAEAAVLLYGVDLLVASLALSLLILYSAREPALLVDDVAEGTLRAVARERWIAIGLNVVAIAMALLAPLVSVVLYLVFTTILLVIPLVGLWRHRRRPRAT